MSALFFVLAPQVTIGPELCSAKHYRIHSGIEQAEHKERSTPVRLLRKGLPMRGGVERLSGASAAPWVMPRCTLCWLPFQY